jgi:iron-sulfur cluster repair protein YtfE (RIC family)
MTISHPDRAVAFSRQLAQAHQELRRRVTRLQSTLGRTGTDAEALATHCLAFCAALTSHHQGEDDGMFAELARARPDLAGKIGKLVEDHEIIGTILHRVADLAERARGADDAALASLKGELDGLAAIMESHFRFEERAVSAALDGVSDTGWTRPVFRFGG